MLIGFAVQPFVASVLGMAFFPVAVGVLVGIVAVLISGCAAYPAFLWMLRRGLITIRRTVLAGAALGNIPAAIAPIGTLLSNIATTGALPRGADLFPERAVVFGSFVGATSAAIFWLIAGRHIESGREGRRAQIP